MPNKPGPAPEDEPSLTQLVMRTARTLRRSTMGELEPFGLTPSQSRALGVISRHCDRPLRLGDIAAHLDIAPRSATEVVDALEERGLVRRSPTRRTGERSRSR
ncbi:MarR family winged helix-turn-helix transcriptional regulator [Flexivirga alba]|uniref:MarR family winged helix-turn-helix transcriptional regulator n=1 Tax=Flexivirga alba TaxID=702742 RepID=A0ABW2AB63_9MICO